MIHLPSQTSLPGLLRRYAWIDNCCIDKTNAVKLSEAINSMFRWYEEASLCYTYLSDVPGDDVSWQRGSKFRTSRWFRRGWTLQELLAPQSLWFYNSEWQYLGTRGSLSTVLGEVTGVPQWASSLRHAASIMRATTPKNWNENIRQHTVCGR